MHNKKKGNVVAVQLSSAITGQERQATITQTLASRIHNYDYSNAMNLKLRHGTSRTILCTYKNQIYINLRDPQED